jgi:hypothetical protein
MNFYVGLIQKPPWLAVFLEILPDELYKYRIFHKLECLEYGLLPVGLFKPLSKEISNKSAFCMKHSRPGTSIKNARLVIVSLWILLTWIPSSR